MQSSQLGILRSNLTIKKCYTLQQINMFSYKKEKRFNISR